MRWLLALHAGMGLSCDKQPSYLELNSLPYNATQVVSDMQRPKFSTEILRFHLLLLVDGVYFLSMSMSALGYNSYIEELNHGICRNLWTGI